ncbi:MAG: hypothetical protein RDV48_24625 [Candidatus Eremiobacteraeota bacterium]|nr:hypothetical protein [Candidatus Eremiobacteraeota bacterium]
MYTFVTYSFAGMRGVQARGVRIAEHLKDKEIVFLNSGDAEWLEQAGYRVIDAPFDSVSRLSSVRFPGGTEAVVFTDIPTNRPYQALLFLAAKQQGIPTVVVENIYHRDQHREMVYRSVMEYADLFLWNGLSCLWERKLPRVHLIPPLIKKPSLTAEDARKAIFREYGIPEDHRLLLASGYKDDVREILDRLFHALTERNSSLTCIVIAASERIERQGNVICTPVLQEEPIRHLLLASDLLVCKKGYLQILEAFSLGTPVVCIGRHEGFLNRWIDPQILEVLPYYPYFSADLVGKVKTLMERSPGRETWIAKVKALHNGNLDGAQQAARLIRKAKHHPLRIRTRLLVSLNRTAEIEAAKKIMKTERHLYPFFISLPYLALESLWLSSAEGQTHHMELDFGNLVPTPDILQYGASSVLHAGPHDMHGWSPMFPWVDFQLAQVEQHFRYADEIIIVGHLTESYLGPLLGKVRHKTRVVEVSPESHGVK